MPSRPRSQKLWVLFCTSIVTLGVGSLNPSNTLTVPRFSATNARPSGANSTAVGFTRPENTVETVKPDGGPAALAAVGFTTTKVATREETRSHAANNRDLPLRDSPLNPSTPTTSPAAHCHRRCGGHFVRFRE